MRFSGDHTANDQPGWFCERYPTSAWIWVALILWSGWLVPASSAPNFAPRWRWSNPLPHGANVYDMAYGLGLTVQVGERGQLYTSEDLVFWQPQNTGTTNTLLAVTFFGERLIAAGEKGTVVYADSLADFRPANLATGDWLLGAAASANVAVLVGDNAAIYTSPEGTNWTRRSPPANFTDWLRSVTYGKNTFIAAGENGAILSSANGVSWKRETSGVTNHLNRVVWQNDQFIALGEGGLLLTSANGAAWQAVTNAGATNALFAAAAGTNGWVVAGAGELHEQWNGVWRNQMRSTKPFPAPVWTYYSALLEEDVFLIAGRSGMMVEGVNTNADELAWILRYESIRNWLWEVMRTPDFYVAVGDRATILTSSDGLTWTPEAPPATATNAVLLGIGGTTNLLLAVGNKGTVLASPGVLTNVVLTNAVNGTTNLVTNLTTTLGVIWQEVSPKPTTNDLQAVATTNGQWIVAGGNGTILFSADGTNWAVQTSPTNVFLSGAAAHPGGFVAAGDKGVILTSPNGQAWTLQNSGTTNWLYRVRFLDGRLFAVGQNGTLLESLNGVNWLARATGTSRWLNDITKVGDTFFLIGNQGMVLASSNAVQWIDIGTITQKSLFGAAHSEGQLVMVGLEGAILRSQIEPDLSPVRIKLAVTPPTNSIARKLFLVTGRPDQLFTLDSSTDLRHWTNGPLLEMLDPTGTLLYLEESAFFPREFFRGRPRP